MRLLLLALLALAVGSCRTPVGGADARQVGEREDARRDRSAVGDPTAVQQLRTRDETAHWLATRFQQAGLLPGASGGYLRPVQTLVGLAVQEVALEGGDVELLPGRDLTALAASTSGGFEGELVFAGYGLRGPDGTPDDYLGLEVRDRVVLVLDGHPTEVGQPGPAHGTLATHEAKIEAARAAGARALLVAPDDERDGPVESVGPPREPRGLPALGISGRAARLLVDGRGPRLVGLRERARRGQHVSTGIGLQVKGRVAVERLRERAFQVVAWRAGSDPSVSGEGVVVTARYDDTDAARSPAQRLRDPAPRSGPDLLAAFAEALATGPAPRRSVVILGFPGPPTGSGGPTRLLVAPPAGLPVAVRSVALESLRPDADPGAAEPGLTAAARAAVERVRGLANAVSLEPRDRVAPPSEETPAAGGLPTSRSSDAPP